MTQIRAELFAEAAFAYRDSHIPYSKLDCQAFVERVLKDCGVVRDWKGSNDMWRNALSWRGTYNDAILKFGKIPKGAWLFTVKNDGGEKARGYNDSDGNAAHVGIYTALGLGAMHSSAGGVQECECPSNRWTHVGLAKDVDYTANTDFEKLFADLYSILKSLEKRYLK